MRAHLVALAATAGLLAACSSTPIARKAAPVAAAPAPAPATPAPAAPANTGLSDAQRLAAQARQQVAELNGKSVLFAFDDYTVASSYDAMIRTQADFLKAHPEDHLTLQGNTDERGGSEYNLALGQKRAEAVRKAMTVLGAPADRIESVSFGKEKPRATCHDESCWSQNRRADFVHALKN